MISVVVPIYNVEKFLSKCIESILNQTYEELEVILVDDGSPDNCGKICDEFATKDKRVKVIHKENGGLSSARNAGLDIATGDYISFVDSDDYLEPTMYSELYKSIQQNGSDISVCCFKYVYENGDEYKTNVKPFNAVEVLSSQQTLERISTIDDYYVNFITAVNKVYKRELFDGLRFEIGRIHEDEFMAHHIYLRAKKISLLPSQLYNYVQRTNSIVNSAFSVKRLDAAYAMLDRYRILKARGYKAYAKKALYYSYSYLINGLNNLLYKENKKIFNPIVSELSFNLDLGMRSVKVPLKVLKKAIIEKNQRTKFLRKIKNSFKNARNIDKNTAIIIATPCHGNLGDQAIVLAEKKFLNAMGFDNQSIIEINNMDYLRFGHLLNEYIHDDDTIVIDGGGNLGTLWPHEDDKISKILKQFSQNRTIIFPQTVYYDETQQAKTRLQKNQMIYSSHKNLTIMFRDEKSYDFAVNNFNGPKILFCPDIVLFLKNMVDSKDRNGVLLCFRDDLECVISPEKIEQLKEKLDERGLCFKNTSTVISEEVSFKKREYVLNKKLQEFAQTRLVITDRLHAMIFATITNTPCIALDNKSKKVSGVYQWIKHLNYVKCNENFDEIYSLIDKYYAQSNCKYDGCKDHFEKLMGELRGEH